MNIVPIRNRLAYPVGVAPGFDATHRAARNCRVSAIPSGVNFVNLLTGRRGAMSAVAGTPVAKTLDRAGPTVYMGGPGSALESICTFSGAMMGVKSHNYTFGVIFAANPNNTNIGGLIGADNYNAASSSTASNGFGFAIGDSRGNLNYQVHDLATPDFDLYFYDHDFSNYSDLTVYFLAVSASFPSGGSGPINIAVKPLRDDPYFAGRNRVVTKTITGAGDTSSALRTGDVFLGGDSTQYIAAAMYSDTFMSIAELRAWTDDPWGFWYPRGVEWSALTPRLPYNPRFVPSARQVIVGDPSGAKVIQS